MGYLNSIWYTVLGTVVTVAMTITTGYCMSKKTLPFRRAIMLFFVFTMYFNGGLIPTYLVVSKLPHPARRHLGIQRDSHPYLL